MSEFGTLITVKLLPFQNRHVRDYQIQPAYALSPNIARDKLSPTMSQSVWKQLKTIFLLFS
jgi:hypothetical protein